jgi:hypothetical protein
VTPTDAIAVLLESVTKFVGVCGCPVGQVRRKTATSGSLVLETFVMPPRGNQQARQAGLRDSACSLLYLHQGII